MVLYNKKQSLKKKKKKKELCCDQMLTVTGKCLCKCLIIYVNLPNNSAPRKNLSAQDPLNVSLPESKSVLDMFIFNFFFFEKMWK